MMFLLSFRDILHSYATGQCDDYKITQNSALNLNAHEISTLISLWTNTIASFIFVEGTVAKITSIYN